MKKYYRFFGGLLDTQENWLNQMAQKGYRLVKAGKMTYYFEECQPGEYRYAVEFVAQQSYKSEKEYRHFLEELGYKVFYKNANLNFSVGKVRWRPYGRGMGQISTNPGSYNKEFFIVEKKNDGKLFELYITNLDKANYYKPLRNAWLTIAVMIFTFTVWKYIDKGFISNGAIGFGTLGILCSIPIIKYQKRISSFLADSNIEE
ncbi:DUF2812 domain-containing protein [Clostridium sp. MB40-C1]|uniref:DUF2812 domain-containing protein n=1 Tax=Clostridium sp. MB40-C1 TaxID=3070996 RepID=UPI0027E0F270|nr:DUF2812 domain-containing protein [Clostridium sp. MB40-C1]WMJ80531.1 DUF2812 domain-containing protein [Clostridium sp. MB40-C1]